MRSRARVGVAIASALLLAPAIPALAETYRFAGTDGQVYFTNSPSPPEPLSSKASTFAPARLVPSHQYRFVDTDGHVFFSNVPSEPVLTNTPTSPAARPTLPPQPVQTYRVEGPDGTVQYVNTPPDSMASQLATPRSEPTPTVPRMAAIPKDPERVRPATTNSLPSEPSPPPRNLSASQSRPTVFVEPKLELCFGIPIPSLPFLSIKLLCAGVR
jgi:hypothetical protein